MAAAYHLYGEGAPLVLLHAFPLHHRMWEPQIAVLGHRYQIIAVDYAGFGRSHWEPLDSVVPAIEQVAHGIIDILDQLDLDDVALAGCSMGTYVALAMYRLAPQRFNRIALCNARASADDDATRAARTRNAAIARSDGVEAIAEMMLPRLLSTHVGPGIRRYVHTLATEAPAETLANALEMIRDRPDARSQLPQMTIPTLVVGATDDPIMPVHESIALAKELPHCQTVILQDCGHLSNIEQPKAFNDAIIAWMQQ